MISDGAKSWRDWIAVFISGMALLVSIVSAVISAESNQRATAISERALQVSARALHATGPVIAVQCDPIQYSAPPADAVGFAADGVGSGYESDEFVSRSPGNQYQYLTCTIRNNGERPAKNIRWHFEYVLLPWTGTKKNPYLPKRASGAFVIRSLAAKSAKSVFLFDASSYSLKYVFDKDITFSDVTSPDDPRESAPVFAWTGFLCPQHRYTVSAPTVKTNLCKNWP